MYKLNEQMNIKSSIELNILVKEILKNEKFENIRIEIGEEILLKSILYYVIAIKEGSEKTLEQVLKEIENSKKVLENDSIKNETCYINNVNNLPIDHPSRILYGEIEPKISGLDKSEIINCFKELEKTLKKIKK